MLRIPSSKLWKLGYLAASLAASGCAAATPTFPTTDRWPDARRQPDGVVVDPMPAPVTGARRGDTSALGAIPLSTPLSAERALAVVHDFFDAVVREDAVALRGILAERSMWVTPTAGRSPTSTAGVFGERFRRLDYAKLAGLALLRDADSAVGSYEDLETPLPGRPTRPGEMIAGDVLVRVRVLVPRVASERLFGDELSFVLRPDRGRYRVAVLFEDFVLP